MKQIYDVKVRYKRLKEDGAEERVTELYVVNAVSCTDAEASATNELSTGSEDGFEVLSVKQSAYREVVVASMIDTVAWYKIKIALIIFDENSGAEKKTTTTMLFDARSITDAISRVDEHMKVSVSDYRILSVSETNVADVMMCMDE